MIKALILSILLPTILAAGLQTENDLTNPKFLGAIIDGVVSGLVDAGFAALNQFLSGLFVSPTIQTILGFLGKREMPDPKILGAIIDGVIDNLVDAGFAALNQFLSGHFVSNFRNNANIFTNNFGNASPQITPHQSGCPPGCYTPMPGQTCYQGICPNGCCEMG